MDKQQTCTKCLTPKTIEQFPSNKKTKSGRDSWCKQCYRDRRNTTYQETDEYLRVTVPRHGLTPEKYMALFSSQDGACKVCGEEDRRRLSIDHDHNCCKGRYSCGDCVRGLLCNRCNKLLGIAEDDAGLLKNLILYLKGQI